ncbi:MAG: hypothetical protein ABI761_06525 [Saprospiraceae bacterium]
MIYCYLVTALVLGININILKPAYWKSYVFSVYPSYYEDISVLTSNQVLDFDTNYTDTKRMIISIKDRIGSRPISEDSLSNIFTILLVNKLIPYWLGTPWSFEGHNSVPRQGDIACGYFVSTTLKDIGFNLNRYKLAQQLPIIEAKSLNLGKPILEINNSFASERIEILKECLKEGIYFIGFDQSHVGYIRKKNGDLFVIHSNYIGNKGVVIEEIETSVVFSYYHRIYVAEISTNQELLKKWLHNEVIDVMTE